MLAGTLFEIIKEIRKPSIKSQTKNGFRSSYFDPFLSLFSETVVVVHKICPIKFPVEHVELRSIARLYPTKNENVNIF